MKIVRHGITRTVFVLNNIVIKIPSFRYDYKFFLEGLLANLNENRMWQNSKSQLLCPVLFCSWFAFFLIMKRADVCDESLVINYDLYKDFGKDDKTDNYGILNGRIVKIDYQ